jgi:nucleotide-binding universal stress UspA family protein
VQLSNIVPFEKGVEKMAALQHIVVGVDFTDQADSALTQAVELAVKRESRLSVLHIIDEKMLRYWETLPIPPADVEGKLLEETKKKVQACVATVQPEGFELEAHVFFGKPAKSMLDYCHQEHSDLLIVGQRGATLLERLLLGSTAERLMRLSDVPVLMVRPGSESKFQNIMVGTDCTAGSISAVSFAASLAKAEDAKLNIVYVSDDTLDLVGPDQQQRERAHQNFESFLAMSELNLDGVTFEKHLAYGIPRTEMLSLSKKLGVDLLILGTAGRSGLSGFILGNTAESIAPALECSLLTIKAGTQNGTDHD